MAIISANRLSKLNGNYVFAANESYGVEDIGRIMMENEMNDMAIFNAALKSDMYELQCRTEGTLLESELQSLSENAVQDFFKSIIEKLKKFWEKMKGLFKKAYAMISAYVVRNGKAFIAANRKELSKLGTTKINGKAWIVKKDIEEVASGMNKDLTVNKMVSYAKEEGSSASDFTKKALKFLIPDYPADGDKSVKEFLKTACFEEQINPTLTKNKITEMITDLETGMKPIKDLKKFERSLEKDVKSSIKELENKAKQAARDSEDKKVQDSESKLAEKYKVASTGITNAMSTTMRAMVSLTKFRLNHDRVNLAKAISANIKTESVLFNSMMLEAAEDIANMEDDVAEEESPEVAEAIETVLDAVEDALEREEGGSDIDSDESCRNC